MKTKLLLSGIMAITIMSPAFGMIVHENTGDVPTGVGGSTTCDTATLGQSENNSTANVEANWNANTISIVWWTDENYNQPYDFSSCTYDGTITLPTQPTKTGYTFNGWRLMETSPLIIDNPCANLSQSECNEYAQNDQCFWINNTCIEPSDFCGSATTDQECSTQHSTLHQATNNVVCSWAGDYCAANWK